MAEALVRNDAQQPIVLSDSDFGNSAGAFILVISVAMGLFVFFATPKANGGVNPVGLGVLGVVALFGLLQFLFQKRFVYVPGETSLETYRGVWPFIQRGEKTLAYAEELSILFLSMRSGHGYRVVLKYSDGRALSLMRTTNARLLTRAAEFAKGAKLRLQPGIALRTCPNDEAWQYLNLNPGDFPPDPFPQAN